MALLYGGQSKVFVVGGDDMSGESDCGCCAVDCGDSVAIIDSGSGIDFSGHKILANIQDVGIDLNSCKEIVLFLTHCHLDHCGGAHQMQGQFPKLRIAAHQKDVLAIEGARGTERMTAASWHGVKYVPVRVTDVIEGIEEEKQQKSTRIETNIRTRTVLNRP